MDIRSYQQFGLLLVLMAFKMYNYLLKLLAPFIQICLGRVTALNGMWNIQPFVAPRQPKKEAIIYLFENKPIFDFYKLVLAKIFYIFPMR